MPQGTIATIPKFQFSANGVPMVGGTLDTYIAGSTTPATTWQDSALTIANTNPISLDARGECVLWLDPAVVYKFVLKNAAGVTQWTQDNISGADAHLRGDLSASSGASLVGANAYQTQDNVNLERVSVKRFGAVGDGVTDDTAAIQLALDSSLSVFFPSTAPNYYKTTGTLTVRSGSRLYGDEQQASIIGAWGADGFTVPAGTANVSFENLEIHGYTALGAPDAKLFAGIKCAGTALTSVSGVFFVNVDRCYFRGCLNSLDLSYVGNSTFKGVNTINNTNGIRLFGQCINNFITNCYLLANGGNASIITVKDGATRGEGLMITGCLLANGDYGIQSDGFLLMTVTGCTIDLILQKGMYLQNVPSMLAHGNWIYANAVGIEFGGLGAPVVMGAAISGNYITVPGVNGIGVYFGANNIGLSVTGGAIETQDNSRSVLAFGDSVSVSGVYCTNSGSNRSIYFASSDSKASTNTGNCLVDWAVGVPSQGGQAVATAAFAGASGTPTFAYGCTTSRTGVGAYTVTFSFALASAAYVPMVTIDRGGNGAMGYAVASQTTDGFSFTVTNQAGTAQDPGSVWVAVFN
jgi:hypothetical protein